MSQPNTSVQRAQGPAPTDRFTRIPDAVLPNLTPREHQLVHALLSYRWTDASTIRPYVGTLAQRLACSKRTVQRALRALEGKGYIVTVARYRDEGEDGVHHGQTSNVYAPGPMLLPLLPRGDDRDVAAPSQDRRPPMTPMSPRNREGNYRQRSNEWTGKYTPPATPSDYLATRSHEATDYYATRRGRLEGGSTRS